MTTVWGKRIRGGRDIVRKVQAEFVTPLVSAVVGNGCLKSNPGPTWDQLGADQLGVVTPDQLGATGGKQGEKGGGGVPPPPGVFTRRLLWPSLNGRTAPKAGRRARPG
jgi:hypothetical protein